MIPHLASWSQVLGRQRADKRDSECRPWATKSLPDDPEMPSCSVWQVPPLTPDERAELNRHFDQKATEYVARVDERARRLDTIACSLGCQVARHDLTMADARDRLDAATYRLDEAAPVAVGAVPKQRARSVARASFARGFVEATR